MDTLQPATIQCPYCWESIEVLVDCSVRHQEYIEDCPVCCRPMILRVSAKNGEVVQIEARSEDE